MKDMVRHFLCLTLAVGFIFPLEAFSETKLGSSVESRVTLAFKVNDEAAQALLPDGWKLLTLPKGPFAGANLLTAFIDKHLSTNADGKPVNPHASRTVAIVNYAVKEGVKGARLFVTYTYETPPLVNPYGNSIAASITRKASLDSGDEKRRYGETWRLAPESGGELTLELSYQSAKPNWISSKAKPYSNKNPEFYRIYDYQQLAELLKSTAMQKELSGDITFKTDIGQLRNLFDGTESLVGILAAPVYRRDIILP